jgi:hypothetical protein
LFSVVIERDATTGTFVLTAATTHGPMQMTKGDRDSFSIALQGCRYRRHPLERMSSIFLPRTQVSRPAADADIRHSGSGRDRRGLRVMAPPQEVDDAPQNVVTGTLKGSRPRSLCRAPHEPKATTPRRNLQKAQ